jgi:hypothetical protein
LFNHLADFFESFAVLMRAAQTILADLSLAWESFLTFSRRSFSSLVATLAMEAFVVRFLWSGADAVSSTSLLINGYICILVKAWSWSSKPSKQFNESSEAFSGFGEQFHEIAITEKRGGKERKINNRLLWGNQVRDGWKELKQKYLQKESAIKNFFFTLPLRRA